VLIKQLKKQAIKYAKNFILQQPANLAQRITHNSVIRITREVGLTYIIIGSNSG